VVHSQSLQTSNPQRSEKHFDGVCLDKFVNKLNKRTPPPYETKALRYGVCQCVYPIATPDAPWRTLRRMRAVVEAEYL
jgi:hypothetical protein